MSVPYDRYLNIRYAKNPTFRADGERLAFLSDISGSAQLWTVDAPLAWPEQLTFYDDRLMFARYSPTEAIIAFGKDAGGNEDQLVYIIGDEGGIADRVSVTQAKHIWGGWSPDGQQMAWTHNGRNGRDFDVYVFDLATGRERLVMESDGYCWVSAWHPGGQALYVIAARSNVDSDIWYVPFDAEPELLTAHEGEISHDRVVPAGNDVCLFTTNGLGEFVDIAELNLRTQTVTPLNDDATWDVEAIALSDDERWLATVRNAGGYSEIEVSDRTKSGSSRVIDCPGPATVAQVTFIGRTARFAATLSGTDDTTDIWVFDATNGEAERWTRSSLAGVPRASLHKPTLVSFDSFDDLEVPAFYWRPDGPGPFPVVIDIHGGPESQYRPALKARVQYYLQRGIATLAPNVRGSRGYGKTYMGLDDVRKRMHSVADIHAAYQWLVRDGGADPQRIALYGGSYGGFMVLAAMVTYPDLWAAGVDIVGVANFVTFLQNTSDYRRHLREAEYGSLAQDAEFLQDISPLTHIDKIAAPLMVIHGRNDPRVPVSEAEQVVDACRRNGVPVECIIYDDEGHGLAKRRNLLDMAPRVLDFLVEHLGLG